MKPSRAAAATLFLAASAHAQWGVNGTRLFYIADNVGVGTTTPVYPFHVRSTTAPRSLFAENLVLSGPAYGVWGQSASTSGRGVFGWATRPTGTTYGVAGQSASTSGRGVLGWATAQTGASIGVWGDAASTSGVGVFGRATAVTGTAIGVHGQTASPAGYAIYGQAQTPTSYSGYFEGGRNYFAGDVGIGTDTPQGKLDIHVGSGAHFQFFRDSGGTTCIRSVGGNFPGAFRLRGSVEFRPLSGPTGAFTIWNEADTSKNSSFNANGTSFFRGGPVAIGTHDAGGFLFAVNGTAAKPGGGSWSVYSDARLKTNIEPLRGTLDRLLSLRGYTFNYLPEAVEQRLALPGPQIGLLAQEVEAVFPDWVSQDESGYKYVTERATTAIMVEALRDLRTETARKLAEARAENADLRARLERLEEQLATLIQTR